MKVLLVEDDEDVKDLAVLSLERAGFDVATASEGAAGLVAAQQQHPDVIILDWMMPGMSGVDVCHELRADPRTEHISVLLLTSRAQEVDIEQGFEAGANDYMVKPFRGRELISRVDALLKSSRRPVAPG